MSNADELLNTLAADYASVGSSDEEPHIVIHRDRTITVPEQLKHIAVQHDHNIETVTFDCPRYWDDHDFYNMYAYINYERVDGYRDQYPTKNLRVDESDDSIIHFEWTISKNATQRPGNLTFLVCIKSVNAKGEEEPHWNSRLNSEMVIDPGMECSEQTIQAYPDVLEYVLDKVNDMNGSGVEVTAKPGQLIRVKETDENGKPTAWEAVPWGYTEGGKAEILPETAFASADHPTFGLMWMYYKALDLKVGESYTVTYNGTPYECVCQTAPSGLVNDPNAVAMGNFSVVGGTNTGEPFALLFSPENIEIAVLDLTGSTSTPTIGIHGKAEIHHPIPGKFLPDGVPYVEDGGRVEVLAPVSYTPTGGNNDVYFNSPLNLVAGEEYIVEWNGTQYPCVATGINADGVSGVLIENAIFRVAEATINGRDIRYAGPKVDEEPFTISIYQDNSVTHPIPVELLPEGVPYVEEGGKAEILPEITLTEENVAEVMASIPPLGLVVGDSYTVKVNGVDYSCVAEASEVDGFPVVMLLVQELNMVVVELSPELVEMAGFNVMMEAPPDSVALPFTVSIFHNAGTIRKLDNRCLDLDWIPVKKYVKGAEVVAEKTGKVLNFGAAWLGQETPYNLTPGSTYVVVWNGVEYTSILAPGDGEIVYGTFDSDAFIIRYEYDESEAANIRYGFRCMPKDGSTEVTLSIYEAAFDNKLPEEFLPGPKLLGELELTNENTTVGDGGVRIYNEEIKTQVKDLFETIKNTDRFVWARIEIGTVVVSDSVSYILGGETAGFVDTVVIGRGTHGVDLHDEGIGADQDVLNAIAAYPMTIKVYAM